MNLKLILLVLVVFTSAIQPVWAEDAASIAAKMKERAHDAALEAEKKKAQADADRAQKILVENRRHCEQFLADNEEIALAEAVAKKAAAQLAAAQAEAAQLAQAGTVQNNLHEETTKGHRREAINPVKYEDPAVVRARKVEVCKVILAKPASPTK